VPLFYVHETFFRPQEHARAQSALPAVLYNDLQLLLSRGDGGGLFIPIRSMQYQAVAERDEIIFVDSHGGYAHQNGEGGRLIRIAWRPAPAGQRESLSSPIPCEIIFYFADLKETQRRLVSEFPRVLGQILQQQREKDIQTLERRILPLRSGA